MSLKRCAFIGSAELGRQLAHFAVSDHQYDVVGFFDDYRQKYSLVDGLPILGRLGEAADHYRQGLFDYLILAIGYKDISVRKKMYERFIDEIPFGRLIHSTSYIDCSAKIGNGVVIYPGCIIDKDVLIEDNVLIHIAGKICHNSVIRKHSYLSPSVSLAGFVKIGECCNIGISTTVIDHISICNFVQTGGGSLVVRNIEDSGLYYGVPAKRSQKPNLL